jgi:hypothetical protein
MVRSNYLPTTKLEQEVILNKSEAYLTLYSRLKPKYIYFILILLVLNLFTSLLTGQSKISNYISDIVSLALYLGGYSYYKSFIVNLRGYYLEIKELKLRSPNKQLGNTKIIIKRHFRYADSLRSYEMIYDGENIGLINNGEQKVFNTKTGRHRLYLKIDLWRSKEISFEVVKKTNKEFECQNTLHGLKILIAPLYITLLRDRYIELS